MSEWKECKLGDVITLNYGKALVASKRVPGKYPVYSSSGISGWHNEPLVKSKGIIVGRKGSIGNVFLSENPFYCIDTAYYILPEPDSYNFKFIYYLLQSLGLEKLNEDSAVPGLNRNTAYNQSVSIPNLKIQESIAEILSSLDDKIEQNNQINANLEALAQAMFEDLFTKANHDELLTIEHYVDFNPAVKIKKGSPTTFVEMKFLPTSGMSVTDVDRKPFTAGSRFMQNDTLLARITPCLENGKTAYVDFLADGETGFGSTEFIVMRAKTTSCPEFVYCLARNQQFRTHAIGSMVGSSGRQRIQQDMLSKFDVPRIEQTEMSRFQIATEPLFLQISANRIESAALKQLRDLLLPKLLSGQISIE